MICLVLLRWSQEFSDQNIPCYSAKFPFALSWFSMELIQCVSMCASENNPCTCGSAFVGVRPCSVLALRMAHVYM